jgi:hypothetical protein
VLRLLTGFHRYRDGVAWRLTQRGVVLAYGSLGRYPIRNYATVWRVIDHALPDCGDVPVELVLTIACLDQYYSSLRHSPDIQAAIDLVSRTRAETNFDPPFVAAIHGYGKIAYEASPSNMWKIKCLPAGTGLHISRFVRWFNLCVEFNERYHVWEATRWRDVEEKLVSAKGRQRARRVLELRSA